FSSSLSARHYCCPERFYLTTAELPRERRWEMPDSSNDVCQGFELRSQDFIQSTTLFRNLLLFKKVADDAAVIFVLDAGKEFGAQFLDCIGAVEGQAFVHHAATEMTGHALGLKYGF